MSNFEEVAAAWRKTRHSRLGALADALSAAEPARPALGASGRKADVAAWLEIERTSDWRDFPRLAAVIAAGNSPLAADRVTLLGRRDDPRIVSALLHLLEHPPYTATSSRNFWRAALFALTTARDARAKHVMMSLSKRYKLINATTLGDWVADQMYRAALAMKDDPPLTAEEEKEIAKLEAKLGVGAPPRSVAPTADATALFAAIVANPRDDDARLVYADVLSGQGDDRGELIVLQIERAAGRGSAERSDLERTKFTKTDALKRFAVPISAAAADVKFERGFPVAVTLSGRGLAAVSDAREWGTIEAINIGSAPVRATSALLGSGIAPSIRKVGMVASSLLEKIKVPILPWTHVGFFDMNVHRELLARLPDLTHLELPHFRPPGNDIARDTLAGAPKLVSLKLGTAYPDADASSFAANPHLRSIDFGRRAAPERFAGLRLSEAEVWGEMTAIDGWLRSLVGVKRFVLHPFNVDVPLLVAAFEKFPDLETIEWSRSGYLAGFAIERRVDGLAFRTTAGHRPMTYVDELCTMLGALKSAGVRTAEIYALGPRHEVPPIERDECKRYGTAWAAPGMTFPDWL